MADKHTLSLEAMGVSLPYSIEAEQAVLGAILVDARVLDEISGKLMPEYFYQRQNAQIYKEILLLSNAGKPVDFVTVLSAVVDAGVFESDEDAKVYLYNITQTVPTVTNVATYSNIVYEKYLTRTLIDACRDIIGTSADGAESAGTLLDYAEQKIYEIRNGRDSGDLRGIDSVLLDVIDHLNKLSGPDRDKYKGLPTGFGLLDRTLTGLNKSDLIIIAARPGVGKTSFALNVATNVASSTDKAVAIFNLEMTKQQLAQRILSSVSGVQSQAFRTGEVRPEEWASIAEATGRISKTNILIDDSSGISVGEIKAKCRRIKNLGLVIVDYLQLMSNPLRSESRVNEISEITRSFKIMAKELDVPIILLSQLSRSSEKQARRPMLSDLRDSGSIEQDADIVLFLHRDVTPEEQQNVDPVSEVLLIVAKNRHGDTNKIRLHWDGAHTTFTSLELLQDD